jgi:hypothetical protein
LGAEDRATRAAAAQAKAEEGQRAADKARVAAEGAASGAAIARSQAETARQDAEARARQATDALARSEQVRKDAEAAKDQAQAKGQEPKILPSPDRNLPSTSPNPHLFLTDIGASSRWATPGTANCTRGDTSYYSLANNGDTITWTGDPGVDIESVISSAESQFRTTTRASQHLRSETNYKVGTTWTYSRDGKLMRVQSSMGHAFTLVRCP